MDEGSGPRSNFAYVSEIRNIQKNMFENTFVSKKEEEGKK